MNENLTPEEKIIDASLDKIVALKVAFYALVAEMEKQQSDEEFDALLVRVNQIKDELNDEVKYANSKAFRSLRSSSHSLIRKCRDIADPQHATFDSWKAYQK